VNGKGREGLRALSQAESAAQKRLPEKTRGVAPRKLVKTDHEKEESPAMVREGTGKKRGRHPAAGKGEG